MPGVGSNGKGRGRSASHGEETLDFAVASSEGQGFVYARSRWRGVSLASLEACERTFPSAWIFKMDSRHPVESPSTHVNEGSAFVSEVIKYLRWG